MTPAQQIMAATGFAPDNLCWDCQGTGTVPISGTWVEMECGTCSGEGLVTLVDPDDNWTVRTIDFGAGKSSLAA